MMPSRQRADEPKTSEMRTMSIGGVPVSESHEGAPEGHDGHGHEQPLKFITLIVANPCACYCFWFWLYFMCLGGTLIATIAAPDSLKPISLDKITEVGLNLPHHRYYQVEQAYLRTPEFADLGTDNGLCLRETIDGTISLIIKDLKDGNILTTEGLSYVEDVIDQIMDVEGYDSYCTLYYGACSGENYERSTSPGCCVNTYLNQNVTAGSGTFDLSNDAGCYMPTSPVQYFQRYGDPTFSDVKGTLDLIKSTSASDFANLQTLLSKKFDVSDETPESDIASVTFYMGSPRHKANATIDDKDDEEVYEDEVEEIEDWLSDKYEDLLDDLYQKSHYSTRYTYSGYDPLQAMVLSDLSKAVIGVCLVLFYMWFSFGSFFLAYNAMYMILMAFCGANLVYRYLWPTDSGIGYDYFTLFNGLSIFIILGIGADDSFVLNDTWIDSGRYTYPSQAHRLTHTYYHAGKAMAVTSATTVISFFSNISSPFVGIKSFGTFAGLLVIVNYIMVITLWPSVVFCYDHYIKAWTFARMRGKNAAPQEDGGADMMQTTDADSDQNACVRFCKGCYTFVSTFDLSTWLAETYAPWLFKFRYFVFGGFMAFVIVMFIFACLVTPTPFEPYTLAPPGDNFYDYSYSLYNDFPKSANPLFVYLLFGLDRDSPVDYGNNFNTYEFTSGADGSGEPHFDTDMDVTDEAFQSLYYETCYWVTDETEFTDGVSWSGLKIDHTYGVNPQLQPGGDDSSTGSEFGVQCLMDALSRHENVSTFDASNNRYTTPPVGGDRWSAADTTECKYCFQNFSVHPAPDDASGHFSFPYYPNTAFNTSHLIDGCNCLGIFPIPKTYCLGELDYVSSATKFHCFESTENFYGDMRTFFEADAKNYEWWKDYIYATSKADGGLDRVALTYIKVMTTLDAYDNDYEAGLKLTQNWEDWVDKYNSYAEEFDDTAQATVYIPAATGWLTTSLLTPNAVTNTLVSLALAWMVLCVATFNWYLASMAILNVGLIVTIIFGYLYASGWGLGLVESILCVLVVGFSVDFTVHLSDTFVETDMDSRFKKTQHALRTTGVSVVAGGLSTLLAASPMLTGQITFFQKFGVFMWLTIGLSLVFSLGFFCCLLMLIGPMGDTGRLENIYGPMLARAYSKLDEKIKIKVIEESSPKWAEHEED